MSANTRSSQLKKLPDELLSNLSLRFRLFKRKYSNPTSYKRLFVRIVMYLLVMGLAFVFAYPFLYMLVTSLMSNSDLNSSSVNWLPTEFKFENFTLASNLINGKQAVKLTFREFIDKSLANGEELSTFKLFTQWVNNNIGNKKYIVNSAFVTVFATFGHVIACSFIGYGFARYRFPLKKVLFALVILAFIVPTQTIIIPSYLMYSNVKLNGASLINTYVPLILPTFFGFGLRGALYIFLFRQFYMTVPRSLEEAARIDGCGFMKTYWKIVFPLAKATLVVAIVLSIVWHWNDSYEPSIYVNSPSKQFLPPRINAIITAANALPEQQQELMRQLGLEDGEDTLNDAVVMAGATIISAPVLIFFAFAQSQFMQGIERSGITGE